MVDVDVRISSHLKEELAWATDKWLRVISTIMLKSSYSTEKLKELKNKVILNLKQYCLWPLVTYSNCFKMVSSEVLM